MGMISRSQSSGQVNRTPDKKEQVNRENAKERDYALSGKRLKIAHNMFKKEALENDDTVKELVNELKKDYVDILKSEFTKNEIPEHIYNDYVNNATSYSKSLEEAKVDIRQKYMEYMINNAIKKSQNHVDELSTKEGNKIDSEIDFVASNGCVVPKKSVNHNTIIGKVGGLKAKGTPNSSIDLVNEKGELLQRRFYGEDGRAMLDVDFSHGNGDGTHSFPHLHIWDWTQKRPRQ